MTPYLTLFLFDILLGFIPQATGCAICLFAFTNQSLKTKNFMLTALIFSAIAVGVRMICDYGIIEFGFHTILIWLIYVIVAIMYNKLPTLKSTISIMISGILIVITEVIAALAFTLIIGAEKFNAIMDNTAATIDGKITRAMYGVPMNLLFFATTFLVYYIMKRRTARIAARGESGEAEA